MGVMERTENPLNQMNYISDDLQDYITVHKMIFSGLDEYSGLMVLLSHPLQNEIIVPIKEGEN